MASPIRQRPRDVFIETVLNRRSSHRLTYWSAFALALAWCVAPIAHAEPNIQFHWQAVAGCPSETEVIAKLERFLGGSLAEGGRRNLDLSTRVVREPDGRFAVRMQFVQDGVTSDERAWAHSDCAALAEGAAHVAAVWIESAVEAADADEPAKPSDAIAAPAAAELMPIERSEPPQAPVTAASARAPLRRERPRGAMRFGGGVGVGDLPAPVAVFRMAGALLWRRVRLELEVGYEPMATIRSLTERDRSAHLQYVAAAVRGCPFLRLKRLELPVCAGVEAGVIIGRTRNFEEDSQGVVGLAAVHVAPGILYQVHPHVAIGTLVEGSLRLLRPRVLIVDYGQIFRVGSPGVRALTFIEVRFP